MYGLGMAKGMVVTLKNFVLPSRRFAQQYPDRRIGPMGLAKEAGTSVFSYALRNPVMTLKAIVGAASIPVRVPQHARFRGEEFSWYEERCTGCASCAKYCPLGIIRIVTDPSGTDIAEGDKYRIDTFDIDIGRCMFCGLCVEACPYDALHMGSGFEEGTYRRDELVIEVDRLREAPKRPSNWFRPQMERGRYDPFEDEDMPWNKAGRHEQPTRDELTEKWANR